MDGKWLEGSVGRGGWSEALQCGLLLSSSCKGRSRWSDRSRDDRGGNSVGVHGALGSLAGTEEREGVRTFLCLSLCLPNDSSGALRVRPNLIPRCVHRPSTGLGTLSINVTVVKEEG